MPEAIRRLASAVVSRHESSWEPIMKIGNATTNWQTPPTQRSSSRGGSFAEQLQQATQAQIGTDSSDPRTQKMRAIVGKYDLDNLSYNQCEKLIGELGEAGLISGEDACFLVPIEASLLPYGQGLRSTEELDHIIVDPRRRMFNIMERARADGEDKQAEKASRLLKFYDEVLATWHQLKGHNNTVSTRA